MTLTLRAEGNRVKIEGGLAPVIRDALDRMLSYQPKGVEFAPSVREGKWDGIVHLFDTRYNRFPRGYLRDVEAYLALEEVPYAVVSDPFPDYPVVNVGWIGPALYDYQREAVNAARGAWRGVIALPTGTGKTLVAIYLISHLRLPAVILVPRLELVDQWERSLKAYLDMAPGVRIARAAEGKVDLLGQILIATNQTATRLSPGMLHKFGVVILDEAHHVPSEVLSDYAKALSSPYIFGLSVGADSTVLVNGPRGTEHLTIEEFYQSTIAGGRYQIRSFDGRRFVWKGVSAIIRHPLGKKRAFRLTLEKGRSLLVTEDHSVYVVGPGKDVRVDSWGNKKPLAVINAARGSELEVGNYLLLEDTLSPYGEPIDHFDMPNYMRRGKWYVAGRFTPVDLRGDASRKVAWQRLKRNTRGAFVSLDYYRSHADIQDRGEKLYTEGARGCWISTRIPVSSVAYLLGYYIGDGWTSQNRVCFAVPSNELASFLLRVDALRMHGEVRVRVRDMPSKSVEVRISGKGWAEFFRSISGGAKAPTKRVPSEVYRFDDRSARDFVAGLLDSDGSLSVRGTKARWYYTTVSPRLAQDVCVLLKRFEIAASNSTRLGKPGGWVRGRQIVGKRRIYVVHFSDHSWRGDNLGHRGKRYHFVSNGISGHPVKILKIEEDSQPYVYDVSVATKDGWPSFVASDVLVHNSATPWREDGRDKELVGAVGPTVFAASLSDMIEKGYLARPTVEFVTVPPRTFSRRLKYEEVVTEYVVKNEERNRLVIAAVKRYEGRQIYVHVRRIIHGEALASRIPGAAWISGTTDSEKRRAVLDHFRSGTLKVLVSTLLGEGVDIPNMEVLVLAAGGKSATATIQTIGRVLRVTAEKKEVVIVDFVDQARFLYDHYSERRRIYESEPAIRIRGVP